MWKPESHWLITGNCAVCGHRNRFEKERCAECGKSPEILTRGTILSLRIWGATVMVGSVLIVLYFSNISLGTTLLTIASAGAVYIAGLQIILHTRSLLNRL